MAEPRVRRTSGGWALIGLGVLLVLAGAVLVVGPGPGWFVLWLGLLAMVAGLVLVARAREGGGVRRWPDPDPGPGPGGR